MGDNLGPVVAPFVIELVVDDLGREEDEASLGRVEAPLRDALCGVPDVRFL